MSEKVFDARDLIDHHDYKRINAAADPEAELVLVYMANVLGWIGTGSLRIDSSKRQIWCGENNIGEYQIVDKETKPMPIVRFTAYGLGRRYLNDLRVWPNEVVPQFIPTICVHGSPALEFHEHMATPELHEFIHANICTQWMDHPYYKTLKHKVNAFFQGGSDAPDGKWFLVECWSRESIYDLARYFNENFRYASPPNTREEMDKRKEKLDAHHG